MTPRRDLDREIALAHELIHQKHFETVGTELIFGTNYDKAVSDVELAEMGPVRSLRKAQDEMIAEGLVQPDSLGQAVIEGIATSGELFVFKSLMEDPNVDPGKRTIARDLFKKRLSEINANKRQGYDLAYVDGLRLFRNIYTSSEPDAIPKILSNIDLMQTYKIKRGTPEYTAAINDPSLLPKLDNRGDLPETAPSSPENKMETRAEKYDPNDWEMIKKQLLDIDKAAFNDHSYSEDELAHYVNYPDGLTIMLRKPDDPNNILGYTSAIPEGPETFYIVSTVIRPDFQGQGLVRNLSSELEAQLRTKGVKFIERDAAISNGYADKITKSYAGRIVNSYDHPSEYGPQRFFKISLS